MKDSEIASRPTGTVLRALKAAAPQTVPVFAGYLVLGIGYGIYVQSLGLPVWMPMLMGTVVYGGSLEFVLASLLLGAFSPLSAFLMALMIQARHLFYGLAMLERYKGYGLRSFYMGSVLPFSTEGVDFVMTAMFVVIFLNQWEKETQHISALIGILVPLVCLVVFGSGSFLLPAMACILVLLLALRKPIEKAEAAHGKTEVHS